MFTAEATSEGRNLPVGADCTLSPVSFPQVIPRPQPGPPDAPVKRVVCSPDLPVFPAIEEPTVDSSTSPVDKIFQCSICRKTFNQKNTYQNHLKTHGKDGEDPYQCNYCGKTFAVPARLTRHYRTHTGEKPYQCEYCKKSFSVKENLSVHRRIHTKERPYKCDVCNRAFEHSGKLHRHMRIHTGERPHKCNICAKTFIQSGQLVIHTRTHTGEKPYICKNCGKGFTCSKQLKVHNRTHTGEKPYSCEICGKSFGYNHVLKLHQVAHYGEKVYKCNICNETFTSKKTMEVHIKRHNEPTSVATVLVRNEERIPDVTIGESSCASSTSDKENKSESETISRMHIENHRMMETPQTHPNIKELCNYLYPRSYGYINNIQEANNIGISPPRQQPCPTGIDTALLEAAAVAAAESEKNERKHLENSSIATSLDANNRTSPIHNNEMSSLSVTEPSVYIIPDPLSSMHRNPSSFNYQQLDPPPEYLQVEQSVLMNLPIPISKADNDHILTPPSSNPVSPVSNPSSSPERIEILHTPRKPSNLPIRKRSKMILESMESEVTAVRINSVIHFAKSS